MKCSRWFRVLESLFISKTQITYSDVICSHSCYILPKGMAFAIFPLNDAGLSTIWHFQYLQSTFEGVHSASKNSYTWIKSPSVKETSLFKFQIGEVGEIKNKPILHIRSMNNGYTHRRLSDQRFFLVKRHRNKFQCNREPVSLRF